MSRRKKALVGAGVFFAFFLSALAYLYITTFAGLLPLPATSTLPSSDAILVKDGYVASFIVPIGNGEALAVDCGMPADAGAIKAELASRSLKLVAVLVTHGHPDHVGGCNALGAPVTALAAEVPGIWGDEKFYRGTIPSMAGPHGLHVKVERVVDDNATLTFGAANETVRVFAVPGHTAGSAVYLVKGVAYFGDTTSARSDGTLRAPPQIFSDDMAQGVKSLHALADRFASENVQTFAFAHSGPIAADLEKLRKVAE